MDNYTAREVADLQAELGGKFAAQDMDSRLHQTAFHYARNYRGSFAYMIDMRDVVARFGYLTDAQAKGVLNCMAAEGKREAKVERHSHTIDRDIPEGKYDVETIDGTFRLKVRQYGDDTVVSIEDADANYGWAKVATIRNRTITAGWKANDETIEAVRCLGSTALESYASAYGRRTGRCGICGRELTDPVSIERGIGPICADKFAA